MPFFGGAAEKAVTKTRTKHTENGGYHKSEKYKSAVNDFKEKNPHASQEELAAEKKRLQTEMGPEHYRKSAAYSKEKAEAKNAKSMPEKIVGHWGFQVGSLGLMAVPAALPLLHGSGSGSSDDQSDQKQQQTPDPTASGTVAPYA